MGNPLFIGIGSLMRNQGQAQAQQAEAVADRAAFRAQEVHADVDALRMDVEKLLMITEALWGILKEKHGYTDEELMRRIQQIDMSDGRLDGKVAKQPPSPCPQCGRAMPKSRPVCMYCGMASTEYPFAR
jgi:hypothetical protein